MFVIFEVTTKNFTVIFNVSKDSITNTFVFLQNLSPYCCPLKIPSAHLFVQEFLFLVLLILWTYKTIVNEGTVLLRLFPLQLKLRS